MTLCLKCSCIYLLPPLKLPDHQLLLALTLHKCAYHWNQTWWCQNTLSHYTHTCGKGIKFGQTRKAYNFRWKLQNSKVILLSYNNQRNPYAYPLSITLWMKVTTSGTYCVMRVRQSTGRIWKKKMWKEKYNHLSNCKLLGNCLSLATGNILL